MRRLPHLAWLPALVLVAGACAPGPEPETDTAGFGETITVALPVGAYPEEFHLHDPADAFYTVDGVAATGAEEIAFTLTVELPELGRVTGFSQMTAVCEGGGQWSTARTPDLPAEIHGGTHTFPYTCAPPGGTGDLLIGIEHHGFRLDFTGTPG
ncbi:MULTISPECIES: hypothetical protein [unclassified Nocardiopsis]|uniref:hypothetical protein n=1 Tax=Nocardiopsis TaxID=2013 RepID=UPI00387AB699